jgi:hypothetical protein
MTLLFDERKLLPVGIYDASLEEIEEHCTAPLKLDHQKPFLKA